jgi:hypothetical protein
MTGEVDSIINYGSSVSDQEQPEILPKGRYKGTIRRAAAKMSQNSTKYADLLVLVPSAQYPPEYTDGNPEGTSIPYRRVSLEDNPQARWRLKNFCINIGADVPTTTLNVSDWINHEMNIEVDHEEYEGVRRPVITRVFAA